MSAIGSTTGSTPSYDFPPTPHVNSTTNIHTQSSVPDDTQELLPSNDLIFTSTNTQENRSKTCIISAETKTYNINKTTKNEIRILILLNANIKTFEFQELIKDMKNLKSLVIQNCHLINSGLISLPNTLTHLVITECLGIMKSDIPKMITPLDQLKVLTVNGKTYTGKALEEFLPKGGEEYFFF